MKSIYNVWSSIKPLSTDQLREVLKGMIYETIISLTEHLKHSSWSGICTALKQTFITVHILKHPDLSLSSEKGVGVVKFS